VLAVGGVHLCVSQVVPGRCHHYYSLRVSVIHCLLDGCWAGADSAQAHVDHVRSIVGGVTDCLDHFSIVAISIVIQYLERQEHRFPSYPGHPHTVVCLRRCNARDKGAVIVVVFGGSVVVDKVPIYVSAQFAHQVGVI